MSKSSINSKDQRAHTRLKTDMLCEIQVGAATSQAILESLSLRGASVASRYAPPRGSDITITVQIPELKKTVTLQGQVVRYARGVYDPQEVLCRFAIRLSHVSPESMQLVKALMNRKNNTFKLWTGSRGEMPPPL